ncbi:hypothetical protein ZWY2020_058847 [Hordeum vulgare]|nr:hypothetical protein ZWY2020_058847 [Hordeum vulgare]
MNVGNFEKVLFVLIEHFIMQRCIIHFTQSNADYGPICMDLELVAIKTKKLLESAIYLEPEILRATLRLSTQQVGSSNCGNQSAFSLSICTKVRK